jgi:hypothetical protein
LQPVSERINSSPIAIAVNLLNRFPIISSIPAQIFLRIFLFFDVLIILKSGQKVTALFKIPGTKLGQYFKILP